MPTENEKPAPDAQRQHWEGTLATRPESRAEDVRRLFRVSLRNPAR
ncbi:MAG: hypothetical protein ACJ79O_05645 [Myxococcales bacterium]